MYLTVSQLRTSFIYTNMQYWIRLSKYPAQPIIQPDSILTLLKRKETLLNYVAKLNLTFLDVSKFETFVSPV